jgi:hypothetical protein
VRFPSSPRGGLCGCPGVIGHKVMGGLCWLSLDPTNRGVGIACRQIEAVFRERDILKSLQVSPMGLRRRIRLSIWVFREDERAWIEKQGPPVCPAAPCDHQAVPDGQGRAQPVLHHGGGGGGGTVQAHPQGAWGKAASGCVSG